MCGRLLSLKSLRKGPRAGIQCIVDLGSTGTLVWEWSIETGMVDVSHTVTFREKYGFGLYSFA